MTPNYKSTIRTSFLIISIYITVFAYSQTVTDIDGNIYNTVEIGTQIWLQSDMKVLHYPDGSPIIEVWSYNDNDSLANIYGRLYTWDAAMNYSTVEKTQGICPNGWHIPSDDEWSTLGNFLGGDLIAGGKLKESGSTHWNSPNIGATNESGFTALPAGEYDDTHYQFLNLYNVIWSSTEASSSYAKYRYLSNESESLNTYTYFKDFRYSTRCIKNTSVGIYENTIKGIMIFPNPVDMVLNITQIEDKPKKAILLNQQGQEIKNFCVCQKTNCEDMKTVKPGIYILKVEDNKKTNYYKIIKK